MPYSIGAKGSYGCSGYPAIKNSTKEVMGCHKTRREAAAQIYAINRSEGNIGKGMHKNIKEGDFVMGMTTEGIAHGVVEHIMTEGGILGMPGSKYALRSMPPENPAMSVRYHEEKENGWEPTAYSIGMMYADAQKVDIETHSMDGEETMKSYYSDNEEEDKWDNMTKACWVGYEQRGMKEKDGRMVPNCVPVGKSNEVGKAKGISVGDHVMFGVPKPPDKTESAHGIVERVERSGTVKLPGTNESVEASADNPVAVVRVYAMDEKGKMTRTDRRVAKPFSSLRTSSKPINKTIDEDDMEKASAKIEARLSELVQAYNKGKEGNKKISVGTLRSVYRRGIGAYRSNPSSVRGSVSSAEQWAMGRVNAFMAGLRGRFPRKPFDLDLFPSGHSRSTKKYDWSGSLFDIKTFKR